jgi:hypothetical protein
MKKIFNSFILSGASALLLIGGTGCLKDSFVEDGLAGPEIFKSPKLIEIMGSRDATTSYNSSSVVSFDIGTEAVTGNLVNVRLAANDPAPEDITVQLELAPELLEAYNDTNATHLEELPSSIYTVAPSDLTVVIPKGEREGHLQITVVPNDLLSGEYALAFRIKSVSNPEYIISGNWNNHVVIVGVKNEFDGVYEVTGTMVDMVNPALTGLFPMTVHLVTTGPSSVVMFDPVGFHDFIHPISNAGNFSGYGSFAPEFTFDADGNITSVVNAYGQPAGNGRSAGLDPSGVNKYDKATKTMRVKYFMYQPGTTVRTTFDETYTYEGPR